MKNRSLITLLILLTGITQGYSQEQEDFSGADRIERLTAQKIAFITNRLDLSPEESEKFWPVYNEEQKQRDLLQAERRSLHLLYARNQSTLSEKELLKLGEEYIQLQEKEARLTRDFHNRYLAVLPIQKVLRLYQAETQYKTFLLQRLRETREARPSRMNRN